MNRSTALRRHRRTTSGFAPAVTGTDVVRPPRPEEMCCLCCKGTSGCATPDRHTDLGCVLPTHRIEEAS